MRTILLIGVLLLLIGAGVVLAGARLFDARGPLAAQLDVVVPHGGISVAQTCWRPMG